MEKKQISYFQNVLTDEQQFCNADAETSRVFARVSISRQEI